MNMEIVKAATADARRIIEPVSVVVPMWMLAVLGDIFLAGPQPDRFVNLVFSFMLTVALWGVRLAVEKIDFEINP